MASANENVRVPAGVSSGFGSKGSGKKATHWKKNSERLPGSIKPVYSAKYPPSEIFNQTQMRDQAGVKARPKQKDAFAAFDSKTSDAWEVNDEELLMLKARKLSLEKQRTEQAERAAQQARALEARIRPDDDAAGSMSRDVSEGRAESQETPPSSPSLRSGVPGLAVRQNSDLEAPIPSSPIRISPMPMPAREVGKLAKFRQLLSGLNTELDELKKLSWSGIPNAVRPTAWKLLLGYLPTNTDRRELTLERKQEEYFGFVEQYYGTRTDSLHRDMFRQIHIDIPRTNPLVPLFQQPKVQEIFERILYIWAIRHPASGYVQGINDLVTPFFVVFLTEHTAENVDVTEDFDILTLASDKIREVEADTFWCMSKLLDGIQDNYTFAQPGIQAKINSLKELVQRVNAPLHHHLLNHQVEYLQFAFRWMNNLLMRELPLKGTIRLWDTYMSEPEGFAVFHLYVCAAFLIKFADAAMKEKDFQGIMLLLQNLPTANWTNQDISLLLAEAYSLKYMFADAPRHLNQQAKK
ncbi:TBC1 domain family member 22B-like [Acanthaster planci]|uniref:TBC1 domain family member 22B-like n=1 Tax=Acanthaster planci TaxID=133434 RepID=A0A8B8A485_ACAPL|nr:TBC1 domain family member 22B-like [Acanthaster planci]